MPTRDGPFVLGPVGGVASTTHFVEGNGISFTADDEACAGAALPDGGAFDAGDADADAIGVGGMLTTLAGPADGPHAEAARTPKARTNRRTTSL